MRYFKLQNIGIYSTFLASLNCAYILDVVHYKYFNICELVTEFLP